MRKQQKTIKKRSLTNYKIYASFVQGQKLDYEKIIHDNALKNIIKTIQTNKEKNRSFTQNQKILINFRTKKLPDKKQQLSSLHISKTKDFTCLGKPHKSSAILKKARISNQDLQFVKVDRVNCFAIKNHFDQINISCRQEKQSQSQEILLNQNGLSNYLISNGQLQLKGVQSSFNESLNSATSLCSFTQSNKQQKSYELLTLSKTSQIKNQQCVDNLKENFESINKKKRKNSKKSGSSIKQLYKSRNIRPSYFKKSEVNNDTNNLLKSKIKNSLKNQKISCFILLQKPQKTAISCSIFHSKIKGQNSLQAITFFVSFNQPGFNTSHIMFSKINLKNKGFNNDNSSIYFSSSSNVEKLRSKIFEAWQGQSLTQFMLVYSKYVQASFFICKTEIGYKLQKKLTSQDAQSEISKDYHLILIKFYNKFILIKALIPTKVNESQYSYVVLQQMSDDQENKSMRNIKFQLTFSKPLHFKKNKIKFQNHLMLNFQKKILPFQDEIKNINQSVDLRKNLQLTVFQQDYKIKITQCQGDKYTFIIPEYVLGQNVQRNIQKSAFNLPKWRSVDIDIDEYGFKNKKDNKKCSFFYMCDDFIKQQEFAEPDLYIVQQKSRHNIDFQLSLYSQSKLIENNTSTKQFNGTKYCRKLALDNYFKHLSCYDSGNFSESKIMLKISSYCLYILQFNKTNSANDDQKITSSLQIRGISKYRPVLDILIQQDIIKQRIAALNLPDVQLPSKCKNWEACLIHFLADNIKNKYLSAINFTYKCVVKHKLIVCKDIGDCLRNNKNIKISIQTISTQSLEYYFMSKKKLIQLITLFAKQEKKTFTLYQGLQLIANRFHKVKKYVFSRNILSCKKQDSPQCKYFIHQDIIFRILAKKVISILQGMFLICSVSQYPQFNLVILKFYAQWLNCSFTIDITEFNKQHCSQMSHSKHQSKKKESYDKLIDIYVKYLKDNFFDQLISNKKLQQYENNLSKYNYLIPNNYLLSANNISSNNEIHKKQSINSIQSIDNQNLCIKNRPPNLISVRHSRFSFSNLNNCLMNKIFSTRRQKIQKNNQQILKQVTIHKQYKQSHFKINNRYKNTKFLIIASEVMEKYNKCKKSKLDHQYDNHNQVNITIREANKYRSLNFLWDWNKSCNRVVYEILISEMVSSFKNNCDLTKGLIGKILNVIEKTASEKCGSAKTQYIFYKLKKFFRQKQQALSSQTITKIPYYQFIKNLGSRARICVSYQKQNKMYFIVKFKKQQQIKLNVLDLALGFQSNISPQNYNKRIIKRLIKSCKKQFYI